MTSRRTGRRLVVAVAALTLVSGGSLASPGTAHASGPTPGVPFSFIIAGQGPTDNKMWLAPANYDGQFYGPVGLTGTATPGWYFSQFNDPSDIPAVTTDLGGGSWSAGNAYDKLTDTPLASGQQRIRIDQDGVAANLPCVVNNGELDGFITPVTSNYGAYPQNMLDPFTSPPIGQLSSLTVSANVALLSQTVTARCNGTAAGADAGYAVIGVPLQDTVSQQTFYYQVLLQFSQTSYFNGACGSGGNWYEVGPQSYGYNDTIGLFGQTCLTPGGARQSYSVDVASRLQTLISSGQAGMDTNLGNWHVGGLYLGTGVEGNVVSSSEWDTIGLTGKVAVPTGSNHVSGTILAAKPGPGVTFSAFGGQCAITPALQGIDGWIVDLGSPGASTVSVQSSSPEPDAVQLYFYDSSCNFLGQSSQVSPWIIDAHPSGPARYAVVHGYVGADITFTVTW
jgi:hypothetical protein